MPSPRPPKARICSIIISQKCYCRCRFPGYDAPGNRDNGLRQTDYSRAESDTEHEPVVSPLSCSKARCGSVGTPSQSQVVQCPTGIGPDEGYHNWEVKRKHGNDFIHSKLSEK